MRATELPYSAYLDGYFPHLQQVRAFPNWKALSADKDGIFLLILDEFEQRKATLYEYDTWDEREQEIQVLRNLPPDTGPDAAVPSFRRPNPPVRPARDAKPLPEAEDP